MIEYFEGIEIIINKNNLKLPHVMASCNQESGIFSIRTGTLIKGNFSKEKREDIETWIVLNEERLMSLWGKEHGMQKISEFSGIIIEMGYEECYTPFIQATHNLIKAHFSLHTAEMIDVLNGEFDDFPYIPRSLVPAWIIIHKDELMSHWNELVKDPQAILSRIRPLQ